MSDYITLGMAVFSGLQSFQGTTGELRFFFNGPLTMPDGHVFITDPTKDYLSVPGTFDGDNTFTSEIFPDFPVTFAALQSGVSFYARIFDEQEQEFSTPINNWRSYPYSGVMPFSYLALVNSPLKQPVRDTDTLTIETFQRLLDTATDSLDLVLTDRQTGITYRLYVSGGVLGIETTDISYVLLDTFASDLPSPLPSTRSAEPGPGNWALVDTSGVLQILDGKVSAIGAGPASFDNPKISYPSQTRVGGLTVLANMKDALDDSGSAARNEVGWASDAATPSANSQGRFSWFSRQPSIPSGPYALPPFGGIGDQGIVLRPSNGFFQIVRDHGRWKLSWVDTSGSASTVYPYFSSYGANIGTVSLDNFRTTQLTGPIATASGMATNRSAVTANGTQGAQEADALIEWTYTAATGVTAELMFRRTDDSNTYILRMNQSGSTAKIIKKVAGVETEIKSVAQTWTNATTYRIVVVLEGLDCFVYVDGASVIRLSSADSPLATFNQTATGVKVNRAGTDLICWPRDITDYLPDGLTPATKKRFYSWGDSKTFGLGHNTSMDEGRGGFQPYLERLINDANQYEGLEEPLRLGRSGYTLAQMYATIDADLAAITEQDPDYVLVNIGANDIAPAAPAVNGTTFQSQLGSVLDKMRAKWPNAEIYVANIYRSPNNGDLANINTWIDAVVAARSWAHPGIDERTYLNNAFYTDDGIHPNLHGYPYTAELWYGILFS
jgi:lysophospholipase L1-like esterase